MKVLVIQPKIGMGDMVIYLPYIHAISKKYKTAVSILVKENSRANQLLAEDKHIKEILILDRTKNNSGTHDGCLLYTSPSPRDRSLSRMPSSA